jgi:hypothetical protein
MLAVGYNIIFVAGVFIQSSENLGNWSANVYAVATNLWSPQILGLDQTTFYMIITGVVFVV